MSGCDRSSHDGPTIRDEVFAKCLAESDVCFTERDGGDKEIIVPCFDIDRVAPGDRRTGHDDRGGVLGVRCRVAVPFAPKAEAYEPEPADRSYDVTA